MKLRRLPLILGALGAFAALLLLAPIAVAVILLRSSSDAHGPDVAAQILIILVVVTIVVVCGIAAWAIARFLVRRFGGRS